MVNANKSSIENPWAVYEVNNVSYVGIIISEYKNSVDILWADFQRIPVSYLSLDLLGRFSRSQEAFVCANIDHDGGERGIIRGSTIQDLETRFKESFSSVIL
jgi:hypothetical protein